MTAVILDSTASKVPNPEIFYPSSDGEPLAESYDHLYAIMTTIEMLLAHLKGQQATVLADREAQRARDLEAQIAIYKQRLGELPADRPNLLE